MNSNAVDVLSQQIEAGRAALVAGAADLPESVRNLWREALKEIDAAVKASEPVRARIERVWGRRELTIPAREQQSSAMLQSLQADVSGRLDRAEKALADIAYGLQEAVTPARPAWASPAEVLDRKADVLRVLERAPSAETIFHLMAEAILAHDDLTAYVIAGGPLDFAFRGFGLDRQRLRSALFRAVCEARRERVPGAGLLAIYEAPHTDPTSWTSLRVAIEGLLGAVGAAAANAYRREAINAPGWGVPSDAEQLAQQRAAAKAMAGAPLRSPELLNLYERGGSGPGVATAPNTQTASSDLERLFEASKAPLPPATSTEETQA